MTVTATGRQILRYVARQHESKGTVWVRQVIPYDSDADVPFDDAARWTWDDYPPLIEAGLLEHAEDWKHDWVRLTDAGWATLAGGAS